MADPPPSARQITDEPLSELLPWIRGALAGGEARLRVPDPALGAGLYDGERLGGRRHRAWQVWTDLADTLGAHLAVEEVAGGWATLSLRPRARRADPDASGYGADSEWQRVNKFEDPVFLLTFLEALERAAPPPGGRVLALGLGSGRELAGLELAFPGRALEVVGLDTDASALDLARARFPAATFAPRDVRTLPDPALGAFDLILSLSLLQSPSLRKDVLLAALRRQLAPGGALILGFPNARYRDGALSYGARLRNFARPDLSLLCSDVADVRRRLHGKGFRVYVTGKYEVLVTAIAGEPGQM